MVEVSPAPGFVSALAGGHVFGAGGTPTGTVPSGSPFPFAGVSNVPGFTISTKSPIQTAAPKTNVGIPYSRTVPTVFAQQDGNLTTVCAGDPVFVCNKDSLSTRYTRGVDGTMRFTHVASVEYLNKQLAEPKNQIDAAGVSDVQKDQRKAILNALREVEAIDREEEEDLQELEDKANDSLTAKQKDQKKALEDKKKAATTWGDPKSWNGKVDESIDFLTLPVFKEWRLDGMLRSIDMDGEPRLLKGEVVNLTDASVSTLLNVIVAGPARARVRDGDGLEQKFTYGPQNRKQQLVNVFDQLVLAVVAKEVTRTTTTKKADGTEEKKQETVKAYEIRRTKRSYKPANMPRPGARPPTTDGQIVEDGVGEANVVFDNVVNGETVVAYWRLGRVVEELSSTDRTCGIVYDGSLVLVRETREGMREVSVPPFREDR